MSATTRQPEAGRLPSQSDSLSALTAFSATPTPKTGPTAPDGLAGADQGRSGISRRHVLTAGAAIAAVGGAAVPVLADAADPVIALGAEFAKLVERSDRLYGRLARAVDRLEAEWPNGAQVWIEANYGHGVEAAAGPRGNTAHFASTEKAIRHGLAIRVEPPTGRVSPAQAAHRNSIRDGLIFELRDKQARYEAAARRLGVPDLEAEAEAVDNQLLAVLHRIETTPARSLEGAAAKLRILLDEQFGLPDAPSERDVPMVRDVLAVVERHAGRATA